MTSPLITRREWLRVAIFAALVLLVISLPYALARGRQGEDRVFSGFLFGVDDGNSYIAKMRLGAQGRWDFYLFYTAEPHEGANLLYMAYILPGQITRLFMDETNPALTSVLIGLFHLMRLMFDGLLIVMMYRFIAAFVEGAGLRLLALILATLGGGFGWLLLVSGSGSLPPEFYIPDGFSLQILLGLPHLALARAALLGGLLLLMSSLESPRWSIRAGLAGVCWLVAGLAMSFYLVIIYCILGAWGLAAWIRLRRFPWALFRRCILAGGLTLPLFAYNVLIFTTNPVLGQWSAQNLLVSPPPLHYLLAYLPLALLAVIGGRRWWQQMGVRGALLIGWPLIVPLLVYLPINVQRRLAEAVIIPLAVLAVMGIDALAQHIPRRWLVIGTLAAALPTSLILLLGGYVTALAGSPQVMYPAGEIAAFDWLNQHAPPGEVVLGVFETGNLVPAYTHLRSYMGLGPETLHLFAKKAEAARFYSGEMTADERAVLYESMHIRYVFYGQNERQQSGDPQSPAWQNGLIRIYADGSYEIYEVPQQP